MGTSCSAVSIPDYVKEGRVEFKFKENLGNNIQPERVAEFTAISESSNNAANQSKSRNHKKTKTKSEQSLDHQALTSDCSWVSGPIEVQNDALNCLSSDFSCSLGESDYIRIY